MIYLYGKTGFELFNPILSDDEQEKLLFNVSSVLLSRNNPSAAGLVKRFPFKIYPAANVNNDEFGVLYAEVPLDEYEELRTLAEDEEGKYAFYLIASVTTEIGPYVRVVACELSQEYPQGKWRVKKMERAETGGKGIFEDKDLIQDIIAQRDLMIDVATGRKRIQDYSNEYEVRRLRIANHLESITLQDPNTYSTLWKWYERWKSGLPTYQSRRTFISDLYEPLIETLRKRTAITFSNEPTGWTRVDRGLYAVKKRVVSARNEEEFQTVGLLCREVLISLAQAVYNTEIHSGPNSKAPSDTDARSMLEAYINHELGGSSNEAARRFAKASLVLANDLQHKRTAGFRDAALCAEATVNCVNVIAIVSGRRGQ